MLGVQPNSGDDKMWISLKLLNCITPICESIMLFVSQVILSRITPEPYVDQLATSQLALAHSNMMMQFFRNYWDVKIL